MLAKKLSSNRHPSFKSSVKLGQHTSFSTMIGRRYNIDLLLSTWLCLQVALDQPCASNIGNEIVYCFSLTVAVRGSVCEILMQNEVIVLENNFSLVY